MHVLLIHRDGFQIARYLNAPDTVPAEAIFEQACDLNSHYHDVEDDLTATLDGMPDDGSQERRELQRQLAIATDLRKTWDRRREIANRNWKRVLRAQRRRLAEQLRLRAGA